MQLNIEPMYLKHMKIFKIFQIHPSVHMLSQYVVAHLQLLFDCSKNLNRHLQGFQNIHLIHLRILSNYHFHLSSLFYQNCFIIIFWTGFLIIHSIIHFIDLKYHLFLDCFLKLILFSYYSHYNPFLILQYFIIILYNL